MREIRSSDDSFVMRIKATKAIEDGFGVPTVGHANMTSFSILPQTVDPNKPQTKADKTQQ